MHADLAADTAVRADAAVPNRFHIALPNHWDYLLPSGGVAMTCALRAAKAALVASAGPEGDALAFGSATTVFASPIHPGSLVADVAILRRGGATAQLRVALKNAAPPEPRNDGAATSGEAGEQSNEGLELIATFIRDRRGPDVRAARFPSVRSLAEAISVEDGAANNPHTRFRFYHQLECRIADGERFWSPSFAQGPARYARWIRYRKPQRTARGQLDRLALPPLIDTMPTALHRAIGPGKYRFYAPSLDLTTYVVDDTARDWLLIATTVRRAHNGWAIADAEVWDDEGRFLAYGTQAMYLHNLSGEPPTIDATSV